MSDKKELSFETNKRNMANQLVRESITEALLKLMKHKNFNDISISELTRIAGVGRVSFYRNYESKEAILMEHMAQIADTYWMKNENSASKNLWQTTFELFQLLKPVVLLIHKSGIDSLFYQFLRRCTGSDSPASTEKRYYRAMYAGLIFGLYDEWLSSGMQETPEQLFEMFRNITLPDVSEDRS